MNENSQAQIIVITGAGSGFGRTTAIELARAGHNVYASMLVADLEGERSASLRSAGLADRRFDEVAPGVQEATGIAPRSFLDFASACGEMFSASIA